MRVVLIGYGEMLRALALGIINSKHEIVGVLRQDTIKQNRILRFFNDYLNPSPDYIFIKTHSLPEINVRSVNSNKFIRAIKKLKADVVIVGSWSERFSVQTLNALPNGFVNVHPSLLPKYRGPNPYMQVILHNEKVTGITFHLMDVNYDTGAILHQKEIKVQKDDTGGSLKIRCCDTARNEIGFLLDNLQERIINQRSQNENDSSYWAQISLKQAVIDFENETPYEIDRKIRALSPWLKCYIPIKGEFFSFRNYQITKNKLNVKPGTIVNKVGRTIFIVCKDSTIMKFSNLKINRPFSKYLSKLFWKKIIKINDRAV